MLRRSFVAMSAMCRQSAGRRPNEPQWVMRLPIGWKTMRSLSQMHGQQYVFITMNTYINYFHLNEFMMEDNVEKSEQNLKKIYDY